jgi:hypothetical protein
MMRGREGCTYVYSVRHGLHWKGHALDATGKGALYVSRDQVLGSMDLACEVWSWDWVSLRYLRAWDGVWSVHR